MRRRRGLPLVGLGSLFLASALTAQTPGQKGTPEPGFHVRYRAPAASAYAERVQAIQEDGVFDVAVDGLNRTFRVPRPVQLELVPCGRGTATWRAAERKITLCHELVGALEESFSRLEEPVPEGELPAALSGALSFVFFHEAAHALVDLFRFPTRAKLEATVDELTAIMLLETSLGLIEAEAVVQVAIDGALYLADVPDMPADLAFWSEHRLTRDRIGDVLCLVGGSEVTLDFDYLADEPVLQWPEEFGKRDCRFENSDLYQRWQPRLKPHLKPKEN